MTSPAPMVHSPSPECSGVSESITTIANPGDAAQTEPVAAMEDVLHSGSPKLELHGPELDKVQAAKSPGTNSQSAPSLTPRIEQSTVDYMDKLTQEHNRSIRGRPRMTGPQMKALESRYHQVRPWMSALADHTKSTVETCIRTHLRVLYDHVPVMRAEELSRQLEVALTWANLLDELSSGEILD